MRYILGIKKGDELSEASLIEIEKYGIRENAPRTVKEYEAISGVDFQKGTISEEAKRGGLPKESFMEDTMEAILRLVASLNQGK